MLQEEIAGGGVGLAAEFSPLILLAQWPTEIEFDHTARDIYFCQSLQGCKTSGPLLGIGRVFVSLL